MKRNKYYPNHCLNGVRKRNNVKRKKISYKVIRECGLADILDELGHIDDKNLVQNYIKCYYEYQVYFKNF